MGDQPATERKTLREWRRERGMTQMQLASTIGATLATVGNLETARNRPNFDTWQKIAGALGITMEQIIWPAEIRPYPSKANRGKMVATAAA